MEKIQAFLRNFMEPLITPQDNVQELAESTFHCGSNPELDSSSSPASKLAFVSCQSDILWNNGETIIYSFHDGDSIQIKKVETTIQQWADCANLKFQREHDSAKPSHIRISFEDKGNWTKVIGKNGLSQIDSVSMNLSSIKSAVETVTSVEQGVILHEWGHVLGLYHEHQRPGSTIVWKKKETIGYYRTIFPDLSQNDLKIWVDINIFNIPSRSNYGKFDPVSIMIYNIPRCCYMVRYGEQGVLPPNQNTELSASDMAYMAVNYPKPCPVGVSPSSTPVQLALRNLNIPSDVCEDWDHSNVRDKFWKYVSENWSRDIHINVQKPEQVYQGHKSGGTQYFKVTTKTDLPAFQLESSVERSYSEFRKFSAALKKKAPKWSSPQLPLYLINKSKWEALNDFVIAIDVKIICDNKEFSEEVRKFLQDTEAERPKLQHVPRSPFGQQ